MPSGWIFTCDETGTRRSTPPLPGPEVVRQALNVAHPDWNSLQRVTRIRMLKKPKRRIRSLTREHTDALHEALPDHLQAVMCVALPTERRMSEILNLEWERVDLGRRPYWLDPGTTKCGEGRGMPFNNDAALNCWPQTEIQTEAIFPSDEC